MILVTPLHPAPFPPYPHPPPPQKKKPKRRQQETYVSGQYGKIVKTQRAITYEGYQHKRGGQHAGLLTYAGDHQYMKSSQGYGSDQDTDANVLHNVSYNVSNILNSFFLSSCTYVYITFVLWTSTPK